MTLAAALTPFDSCDALLDHLRTEALDRVGPYGLDGEGYYGPIAFDDMASAEDGAVRSEALPGTPVPTSTIPTSGTNTQEAFVDEPDIVKVTPDRMVLVDDDVLRIVDLSGDEPVARGTVRLPGWGQEILVVGDRVLAIGSNEEAYYAEDAATTWSPYGAATSVLSEIDISDPDAPTIVHALELDSAYLSARLVGETARVVVSAAHPGFPFVYPSDDSPQARTIAEETNRRVIEEATLEDWLPGATLDDEAVDVVDCATVQRPEDFSGFGFLSVLTVDLTQPLAVPPSATVLADGQTVYASTESLYVATSRPQPVVAQDDPGPTGTIAPAPWEGEDYETALHRFAITGTGAATYVASGVVPGHLVDQFSLSEHEGRLRVATTEGAPWSSSEQAASRVAVLETDGQALVEVGAVEGLGRTEQIYSVRFIGDTAYVVTFRQTDPLFVVDLSDPTAPVLAGRARDPGLLRLPAPHRRGPPAGHRPGRRRRRHDPRPPGLGLRRDRPRPPHPGRPGGLPRHELGGGVGPPRLPLLGRHRPGRPAPDLRPVHRAVGRPRPRRRAGPHRPPRRPGGPPQHRRRRPPPDRGRRHPGHQLPRDPRAPERTEPLSRRTTTDATTGAWGRAARPRGHASPVRHPP